MLHFGTLALALASNCECLFGLVSLPSESKMISLCFQQGHSFKPASLQVTGICRPLQNEHCKLAGEHGSGV